MKSLVRRPVALICVGCVLGFSVAIFLFSFFIIPYHSTSLLPSRHFHTISLDSSSNSNNNNNNDYDPSYYSSSSSFNEISDVLISPNATTAKLLECLHLTIPNSNAIIVPTRTQPSFAITIFNSLPSSSSSSSSSKSKNKKSSSSSSSSSSSISKLIYHPSSFDLLQHGVTDAHLLHVMTPIFHHHCIPRLSAGVFHHSPDSSSSSPPSGIVIDASHDLSFLGFYAASIGCEVDIIEHQSWLLPAITASACANPHFNNKINIIKGVLQHRRRNDNKNDNQKDDDNSNSNSALVYNGVHVFDEGVSGSTIAASLKCELSTQSLSSASQTCHNTSIIDVDDVIGEHNVLLFRSAGDRDSLDAIANSHAFIEGRMDHILFTLWPTVIGDNFAKNFLLKADEIGYEITLVKHIDSADSFSIFTQLRSALHSSSTAQTLKWLAGLTQPWYMKDLKTNIKQVAACEDERHVCHVDLLLSIGHMGYIHEEQFNQPEESHVEEGEHDQDNQETT